MLKKLRNMAGYPIYMLIALGIQLKLYSQIPEQEIENISNVKKNPSGLPETDEGTAIPLELYNWCGEILKQVANCDLKTDEEIYKYIYQLLVVMYKCSEGDKLLLLHGSYRKFIEMNLMKAFGIYFKDYKR